jgi:Putative peptidoglycan binding domain
LASGNFSEVRSADKKCRLKSFDLAAQLRNLGLTGRGFSPVFSGMRVSPSGRFSGRGDDGRFRDGDFGRHGNSRDNDERHHRHFFSDFDFVAFGFPYWWYPDYGYPDYGYSDEEAYYDSAPAYGDQYWQDLAMKVQWALSRRGYYNGPIDGVIGPDCIRAIRAFQEAQGLPATGQIDPNVLRALKLPLPQVSLRSN